MRIRITPLFIVYAACVGIMTSWQKCACALSALFIHEGAHYLAAKACGEQIESIVIAPFGGVMECRAENSAKKGLLGVCIALAGPGANYLMICMLGLIKLNIGAAWAKELAMANLSLLMINLIPAAPLDGGRVVFCLCYYFMNIGMLSGLLSCLGILTGFMLIAAGSYGVISMGIVNLSLYVVGCYMIVYAKKSREIMLAENRYAVLQERRDRRSGHAVGVYRVDPDSPVVDAVRWLGGRKYSLFLCVRRNGTPVLMTEGWVIDKMIRDSGKNFGEICESVCSLQDTETILQ